MKKCNLTATALAVSATLLTGGAIAHDIDSNDAGTPVCLEANFMLADAMNAPFSNEPGPGRVMEMNIITSERGITVNNPFNGANAGTPICPDGLVECPGPWKPTGTFSGGQTGHSFLTSAGQQALTEFHRDGTPIRTVSYRPLLGNPTGPAGRGTVPRPLGTQIMPNGNLVQAICDANFFNAQNSDSVSPNGNTHASGNASNLFFPPVYSTPERAANSRVLVIDQDTLEVIDEYSQPKQGSLGHDLWGCMAGISFTEEGMLLSFFHSGAVMVVDWRDGVSGTSSGVGANDPGNFQLDRKSNQAKVTRVIDFVGGPADNPHRRDTLRANTLDEGGNVYATNRRRSEACEEGDACNPGVFRQRISIDIITDDSNPTDEDATLALDPGVNVIAGIRINRMSKQGCDTVTQEVIDAGGTPTGDECDVETLYVAASAMNPGCVDTGPVPANPCFRPGGHVVEYLIDQEHLDGGSLAGDGSGNCNGNPNDPAGNTGCALPIAEFRPANGVTVDPRMLMPIQRAYIQ